MAKTYRQPIGRSPELVARDGDGNRICNQLFLGLPKNEIELVFPKLELVRLKVGQVLHEVDDTLKSAYFCNAGLISTWTVFPDGKTVVTGIIGSDGYIGTPLLANLRSASTRAVVQMDGAAWRVSAETLAAFLRDCPELRRQLQCSAQIMAMEATQIGVCNALHDVEQRLTRCLLMCADRSGNAALPLTQEVLAKMLGIRRATITIAAGILQRAGIIAYARGNLNILKRSNLEARSCALLRDDAAAEATVAARGGQSLKDRYYTDCPRRDGLNLKDPSESSPQSLNSAHEARK